LYWLRPTLSVTIYFDVPSYNGFFDNRPGNGGAVGVQANPTGATPVVNVSNSFYQWQAGVDPFSMASGPAAQGLATISIDCGLKSSPGSKNVSSSPTATANVSAIRYLSERRLYRPHITNSP
jgi:hypothetical protein